MVDPVGIERVPVDRPERARWSRRCRPGRTSSVFDTARGRPDQRRGRAAGPGSRERVARLRAHAELHEGRRPARRRRSRRACAGTESSTRSCPAAPWKSTTTSARWAGPSSDPVADHGLREQAVAGADLEQRAPVGEADGVRREVRGVEQPQPVARGADPEVRRVAAVDEHVRADGGVVGRGLGSRPGHRPVRGRPSGARAAKGLVSELSLRNDRSETISGHVAAPARQPQLRLVGVLDDEHALEAAPVVAGRPVHPVVVVEEERARLRQPAVGQRVVVGAGLAGPHQLRGRLAVVLGRVVVAVEVDGHGARPAAGAGARTGPGSRGPPVARWWGRGSCRRRSTSGSGDRWAACARWACAHRAA